MALLLLLAGLSVGPASFAAEPDREASTALEMLAEATRFETVAGKGQVCPYAKRLQSRFLAGGFAEADARVFELPEEDTCSLVIRYPGNRSELKPVILMAHLDVVDARPADWTYPPFELTRVDDRLYGRGVLDNKGSVVAVTATLLKMKSQGFHPARDLYFVVTGDEETTATTTRRLFSQVPALSKAEYALNADAGLGVLDADHRPVYFQLQVAEKTYATFELTATNPGGHSSIPRSDNAIYQLANALVRLQRFKFPVRTTESTIAYFTETARLFPGSIGQQMAAFAEDPSNQDAIEFLDAMPGEAAVMRTTCVATLLQGGHAENALPQSASAAVNCRIFPGVSLQEVQTLITEAIDDPGISIRPLFQPSDNPPSALNPSVNAAVSRALQRDYPGLPIIPYLAPYSTDGAIFRAHGIPTYGVSGQFIRYPDDKRAHGQDEFLPVDSFVKSLHYWDVLIRAVAEAPGG